MTTSDTMIAALRITYEVMGQAVSDLGLAALASDLAAYPEVAVLAALARCRRECRRLSLAEILDRLPGGHPGPEEAWAIVAPTLADEAVTVVWTDEMAAAAGVVRGLARDPIAARKAFQEYYIRAIGVARAAGRRPSWGVSLGWDKAGRELVLREAVAQGRLTPGYARTLCPSVDADGQRLKLADAVAERFRIGCEKGGDRGMQCKRD